MEKAWIELTTIVAANPVGWNLALGALGATAVIVLNNNKLAIWGWRLAVPNAWRGHMAKRARRELVRIQASYDFISAVMDRQAEGLYSSTEAKEIIRDLKKCFPIVELYPSPELLKENIRQRTASGMHAPVQLEPVRLDSADIPSRPKHMFDKA